VPAPTGCEPAGARLYRTGDLVRWQDGVLLYLGRADSQVKLRGFRIELGEVETLLQCLPGVRQAVAAVRERRPGDRRLLAYVLAEEGALLDGPALCARLRTLAPAHLVPACVQVLERLPLTPNGKVDRLALPEPTWEQDTSDPSSAEDDELDAGEQHLAAIWQDVLGVRRVRRLDRFFALGGHSLLALQVLTRVRQQCGRELPLRLLFANPTLAQMAELIARQEPLALEESDEHIPAVPRDGSLFPVSSSQERVWFVQQLAPQNHAYRFQSTLRFLGTLDIAALQASLSEIVRRHEIFRTTFPVSAGRPVQRIHEPEPVALPMIDLSELPATERAAALQQKIDTELQQPMDLTALPLIRWILIRLQESDHVLLHIEHHLVHDGWSFNLFLHELHDLYQAFAQGHPSPLPAPGLQFADFACWQKRWLEGVAAEGQLRYWKRQLADAPVILRLPTDHPRPEVPSFRGAVHRAELPPALCRQLRDLGHQEGVTLFMTMLAAFTLLLYRYSGQTDLCVGSGIANRRWRETEDIIGMFVNNVVLRTDVAGNPSFRELLGRVREVTLDAYANQELPFDKVVEALRPTRDLSINPLFQVMFSFHDSPMRSLSLPGLEIELTEAISNSSAKFDLNIIMIPRAEQQVGSQAVERAEGITVLWEYSGDLFSRATIERMFQHYHMLLTGIVADPGQRIAELPLLTERERWQILQVWNTPYTEQETGLCLHELVEAQARREPERPAIFFHDVCVPYGELNRRSDQLAHHLRSLGVGPGILVGLCVEPSVEMIVGLLGILKAGSAFLPLDPGYPPARLEFMVQETQTTVLLLHAATLPVAQTLAAVETTPLQVIVCLDESERPPCIPEIIHFWNTAETAGFTDTRCACVNETRDMAYLMYTSGSTGQPKGVPITHKNLVPFFQWHQEYFAFTPEDRVIQYHSLSFDFSVWEIFEALLAGASLSLVSTAVSRDVGALADYLRQEHITMLNMTPSQFSALADYVQMFQPDALGSLRLVVLGGEALSPALARKALQILPPGCRVFNEYGPTETTISCAICPITADLLEDCASLSTVPIGRPSAYMQLFLLDSSLQPVPVGVPGEIYIGGPGNSRGYFHRAELTAERFIIHPFSRNAGSRLYRSGDLAYYLPDGTIVFLGRVDSQVKIRGFRIEPGEVEAVLAEHPLLQEAAVTVLRDAPGGPRLAAYVVPRQAVSIDASRVKTYLKERVPEYMIPSTVVVLQALPLTPNGKIDRQALPAPDAALGSATTRYIAPRNATEETLAGIWSSILKISRVGIDDDFFDLGGHSLLATQVISRIREELHVDLPLRTVFEMPTVAEQALAVIEKLAEAMNEEALTHLLVELER
jgi:amino acid adenylation domain-containing protein